MSRRWFGLWLLLLLACRGAAGQEWAEKMFTVRQHDFGTVARGAKVEYRFELQNSFVEDVHIQSVRSSCGCTTPVIENDKRTLKTWESTGIIAEFNTRQFTGDKSATIYVTLDKPFHAEVQLTVRGKIRSDVVVEPGILDFGRIDEGHEIEKRLHVVYAGRDQWQLVDVRSALPVEVNLVETERGRGRVAYDLIVKLTKETPSGYLAGQLTLVTNDPRNAEIPVSVEGRVASAITLSTKSILLGALEPGQTVTRKLVITGQREFKIVGIECDNDDGIEVSPPKLAKKLQVLPVTYTAGDQVGKIERNLFLKIDHNSQPLKVSLVGEVIGRKSPASEPADEATDDTATTPLPKQQPARIEPAAPPAGNDELAPENNSAPEAQPPAAADEEPVSSDEPEAEPQAN